MAAPRDRRAAQERRAIRAEAQRLRREAQRLRDKAREIQKRASATRRNIKKLPPADPAARDEGPRLIPFRDNARKQQPFGRALDLGDIALGNQRADRRHAAGRKKR